MSDKATVYGVCRTRDGVREWLTTWPYAWGTAPGLLTTKRDVAEFVAERVRACFPAPDPTIRVVRFEEVEE